MTALWTTGISRFWGPGMRGNKHLWLLLVVSIVALIAACGSDDDTDDVPRATATFSTPVPTAAPVGTQVPSTPPKSSQPSVFLWPPEIVADGNGMATFNVWVNTGSFGISGGEVTLNYRDSGCSVQAFASGTLLGENPIVGHGAIDNDAGVAVLALARIGTTNAPSPSGSFATVTLGCPANVTIDIPSLGLSALMADHQFKKVPLVGGSAG